MTELEPENPLTEEIKTQAEGAGSYFTSQDVDGCLGCLGGLLQLLGALTGDSSSSSG